MDVRQLVEGQMFPPDKCLSCLVARVADGSTDSVRVLAVVESQGEYALFVYKCLELLPRGSQDLCLDRALPVNTDFKFSLASQSTDANQGSIPLRVTCPNTEVLLELPQTDQSGAFLGDLKNAMKIQSENAGFGIRTMFMWLDKYSAKVPSDTSNPFLDFDPLTSGKSDEDTTTIERSSSFQDILEKDLTESGSTASFNNFHPASDLEQSIQLKGSDMGLDFTDTMAGSASSKRENIIKLAMKRQEEEYTEVKSYRVFCGTWNTNGQAATESLQAWLCPPEDDEPPDIYAIGFQELDLSKNAYIFSESPREAEWYKQVRSALHPKGNYRKVKLVRLVGMMIIVFIKNELADQKVICDVYGSSVGTGLLGMVGNKGGVGVRFQMHDTTLCFVNCHLAAHAEEYERRNQDFRGINNRLLFNIRDVPQTISDHDIVFWIGDLNYRLSDIEIDKCKQLISQNKLVDLMAHDQLVRQIQLKRVFLDYVEGRINFIPTYKYDTNSDTWDTSEKNRAPAWCDRILWRGSHIRQLKYRSHMKLRLSDHKPVSGIFDMGVLMINKAQYRRVYEDVMKQLDRLENEFLPQITLDTTEVKFDNVKFVEPQTRVVTLTNAGQVPVRFEFITKPGDKSASRLWLNIEPGRGLINVGRRTEVQLEVYVEKLTASELNIGFERIEDILVLHLDGGKDLFITVTGTYLPSSFGSAIENLVHMFAPIREVPLAALIPDGTSQTRPLDIPKELWRLTDHLFNNGMDQEDLFQVPGLHSEIQMVRDCLDTGSPDTIPGSVHSVAEALLLFLDAFPVPVVPHEHYNKCLESCSNFTLCKQIFQKR